MNVLRKVALPNKSFNLIFQLNAFLNIIAMVMMKLAILALIMGSRWSFHQGRPPQILFFLNLHEDFSFRSQERVVVTILVSWTVRLRTSLPCGVIFLGLTPFWSFSGLLFIFFFDFLSTEYSFLCVNILLGACQEI